ncbi:hypothetical protein KDL01_22570 [Actinospica durhamensis]|uniref:Uncharacterized protein n=1 Tax=Actinospica durhamensis TaxID=1508375 RepID=A0A941ERZ1_9ACTN|nr:hypothetical protein [Actinospica durhamensis]MBR7836078.1 hypothetical protein [Actinospica durhamensis]
MPETVESGLLAEDLTEVDWTELIAEVVGDNLDDLDVLEIQACGGCGSSACSGASFSITCF